MRTVFVQAQWSLGAEERQLRRVSSVDAELEEGVKLLAGSLVVTTHRLAWLPPAPGPASLLQLSEVVEVLPHGLKPTGLFRSRTPRVALRVAQTAGRSALVSFAFRGDPPAELLSALSSALSRRAWVAVVQQPTLPPPPAPPLPAPPPAVRASDVGVAGILRRQEAAQQVLDQSMGEAFRDLTALMDKAREMMAFAERVRASSQREKGGEGGMDELLESCLLSLGVATPVTRQSAGSLYHQQLSQQLADFLGPQLERARGVLTLPDVFCLFNRARGSELVSPSDVIKACSLWERMRVPLRLHRFSNGVLAVMSTSFDTDKVNRALVELAREHAETGIGVAEAARVVGMAPAIAREQLLAAELQGALCRDEAPDGVRWFCNPWRE